MYSMKLYNSLIKLVTRLSLYSCMKNYDSNVIDLELMILVCAVFNLPWPGNLLFDQRSLTLIMHFFSDSWNWDTWIFDGAQYSEPERHSTHTIHTHVNTLSTLIQLTQSGRYSSYIHTYREQLYKSSKSETKDKLFCLLSKHGAG